MFLEASILQPLQLLLELVRNLLVDQTVKLPVEEHSHQIPNYCAAELILQEDVISL